MIAENLTGLRKYWLIVLLTLTAAVAIAFVAGLVQGLSALLLAIVVGTILRNTRALPASAAPAISWSSRKFLRIGIVLLGFKLSLGSLVQIGPSGIAVLLITVLVTFVGTVLIGKVLRVSRVSRMLVATGFSICGASAVAAMSSIVDPEGDAEEEVAQAVALVTIFGTVTMFALPALVPVLQLTDVQAGLWIGASVHEVAQVVAAGGFVSAAALTVATLAKLGRVVLLAPLIAIVGAVETLRGTAPVSEKRPPILPLFVAGFLAAVLIRTLLQLPTPLLSALEYASTLLLTAAMFGLGFGVDVRRLIATGWRPVVLGALSTVLAATTALIAIALLAV